MSSLREVQLCGLRILKEVVRVCEDNDLTYYLNWGTLLGAIRHKGFIPWDNDIDISMPVKDYKKFLIIAPKELPKELFLQTFYSDRGYNEMWAKVRSDGTTSLPLIWKDWHIHFGIGIDIFPMISWYDSYYLRILQKRAFSFCRTLLAKEYIESIKNMEAPSIGFKLRLLFMIPWRLRILICKLIGSFVFQDMKPNSNVALVDTELRGNVPVSAYGKDKTAFFEDGLYRIPEDYDSILKQMYGEYMIPPPLEMRGKGHEALFGEIIYDCLKDYREYVSDNGKK